MPQTIIAPPRRVEIVDPQPRLTLRLRERSFESWDNYVSRHPLGTPFHLSAWKNSIEETFGYRAMYLEAERNGGIVGVMPLFLVSGLLTGKVLLSTPFAVYGGTLADDVDVYAAFAERVRAIAFELGVQYVECRNRDSAQSSGFSPLSRYVTFTQQLDADEDALLESIPRKTRRMVRKSLCEGFCSHVETDNYQPFADQYSANLRRLGTPAFPNKHFENLLKHFRGSIDIREIRFNGALASSVLTIYFRDSVFPYYGASDPAFNAKAPNNFMYYDLMRQTGAQGFRLFDFGRSKKGVHGSYDFKAHWGMVERELPYEMLLVRRKQLPNFTPSKPAFQWPMRVWRRLPLGLTRRLGPLLVRLVP